ncbi:MAG TPA: DUF4177 domain-containing protein [Gemmatimonadales bacterium]|nr:DUF4177 domain-containing protein [Gemmatimonadales bacterium]
MYSYKVVEQKHKSMLGGRFKPVDLEDLLNQHAMDGWEFDRIIDGEIVSAMTSGKEVFLVVFKRRE